MSNILFVCTGNTCRSPMAEGFAKMKYADGEHMFFSRGLNVIFTELPRAESNAVKAAKKVGNADIDNHTPTQLSADDVIFADLIITMTETQKYFLLQQYPKQKHKFVTLPILANSPINEVADPFGGNLEIYIECAKEIKNYIDVIDFTSMIK